MSKGYEVALPEALKQTLSEERDLHVAVLETLASFGQWLDASNMPFFPEFTEHGTNHVVGVIRTAWHVLSDAAQSSFSARDVAILVLAALFHDSAMHLSEDGFLALLTDDELTQPLPGFMDLDWPSLWASFSAEAARWDERQSVAVYGDPEPQGMLGECLGMLGVGSCNTTHA